MKKIKDEAALAAKRQWVRLNPENTPSLKGIALNQGSKARVVDISRGGALIETDARLGPQTKIRLKVLTEQGDVLVMGSVLRSSIKSLKGTPIYESAIVFENPLTIFDELVPSKTEMEEVIPM